MSDDIQHIDIDGEDFESAPKALRDYAKSLKKRLDTVTTERDGFRDQMNESALSGVLTGFKNPERVKSALLNDKVNPLDSEAVTKWIESNGDDYARADGAQPPAAQQQPDQVADAYQAFQPPNTYRPAGDMSKLDAVAAQLPADATQEQVAAAIRAAGI